MHGKHARLLIGGLDQAVAEATMLGAFADGVNACRAGLQLIADQNAAGNIETGAVREIDIGLYAGSDDHQISLDLHPAFERHSFDPMLTNESSGFGVEMDGNAAGLDRAQQHGRGARVELALHQPIH
jgi:hypothetical protein